MTELIVDLRYNGGGLISIAELFGDLMGGGRAGQVFELHHLPRSKGERERRRLPGRSREAIAPTRIAFIGTGGTASASEMVINGMVPYLGANMALVGSNTYGKPVGQIALDRPECDDRLRAVALKIENANRQGEYYTGLAARSKRPAGRATTSRTSSATRTRRWSAWRSISSPAAAAPRSPRRPAALTPVVQRACAATARAATPDDRRRGAGHPLSWGGRTGFFGRKAVGCENGERGRRPGRTGEKPC